MVQVSLKLSLSLLFACLAVALSEELPNGLESDYPLRDWEAYKLKFQKRYDSLEEDGFRLRAFTENMEAIINHNERFKNGEESFELGLNTYSDMFAYEVNRKLNGYRQFILPPYLPHHYYISSNESIPDSVDWRQKGAVTPVKNQGMCGSCWAFSTTGSLEGQHFLKQKKLVSLSEQNLVECSKKNFGCLGGQMTWAFDYIKQNKGIDTEESYPYTGIARQCRFKPENVGATVTGYKMIKAYDENELKKAVATVGPISVAIDAHLPSFQLYKSGVYHDARCSSTKLNHGVLVVGYGTENGKDYWLVKNSWGEGWGDKGYIKMSRNQKNNCGIATAALFPEV